MSDLISRQDAIDAIMKMFAKSLARERAITAVNSVPSAEPERKKDLIQKFHDYQVEWLTAHCDLELEPELEKLIVRFLHDTANLFMLEVDNDNARITT